MSSTGNLHRREGAEIARSGRDAVRTAPSLRPTSEGVRRRYANPAGSTPYPLEYAYHLVGDLHGKDVLDLGCGSGGNTTLLAARGARVLAMDLSHDLLALARERVRLDGHAAQTSAFCGSVHALPLPDASVDLVFGNAVLHHVDFRQAAVEVCRVLRPGGRAVFKEPIRDSRVLDRLRRLIPYQPDEVSPYERPLTRSDVAAFTAGFTLLRQRTFHLPFVRLARWMAIHTGSNMALSHRVDRHLLDRFPALERFAAILVFEIRR